MKYIFIMMMVFSTSAFCNSEGEVQSTAGHGGSELCCNDGKCVGVVKCNGTDNDLSRKAVKLDVATPKAPGIRGKPKQGTNQ